jgi:hypothetical protein
MLLLWWCPFKIQKEKRAGLQFTITDYLSLSLTPLRIRWTIPLIYTSPSQGLWVVAGYNVSNVGPGLLLGENRQHSFQVLILFQQHLKSCGTAMQNSFQHKMTQRGKSSAVKSPMRRSSEPIRQANFIEYKICASVEEWGMDVMLKMVSWPLWHDSPGP